MSIEKDGMGRTFLVDDETGGRKEIKLERHSLIPPRFLAELAEHFGKGAEKYDDNNYLKGYDWSASIDALSRHLTQWREGEINDPETASHHMIAVAWHACALFMFETYEIGNDDRWGP